MVDCRTLREMHELDVRRARENIRAGCENASTEWEPADAIADALLLECIDFTAHMATTQHLIELLERVLSALKANQTSTPLQ